MYIFISTVIFFRYIFKDFFNALVKETIPLARRNAKFIFISKQSDRNFITDGNYFLNLVGIVEVKVKLITE